MRVLFISLFLVFPSFEITAATPHKKSYNDFETNPHTSKSYRKSLSPHLMPVNHPIKEALDNIFKKTRVTSDLDTFKAAGFKPIPTNQRSLVIVATHPDLPGYVVKVSLDDEIKLKRNDPSWLWFVRRCELAKKLRAVIKKQKCYYFSAPEKWIYPLPINPPPSHKNGQQKNEILVVTDMNLVSPEENDTAWENMTKTHLKQLYKIITFAGGCSYRKDNIPFTKSGRFAFIDTEYPFKRPNYDTVLDSLSPKMREYWMKLVRKGRLVY